MTHQVIALPRSFQLRADTPASLSIPINGRAGRRPVALTVALRYLATRRTLRRVRLIARAHD